MDFGGKPLECGRAWVEIDLEALAYNVSDICSRLPDGCRLMAVVKADAYGHGAVRVAERLEREGVAAFAVATICEGIQLRKSGLKGDILVMGYTSPKDAGLLGEYRLTQLVVDADHAMALNGTGHKIRVHVAIDTGMRRLGADFKSSDEVEKTFRCDNLTVEGIATHLASSDSLDNGDIDFTKTQMARFFEVADKLGRKGYDVGVLHAQASYGIYNFPEIACDYVRAGIALYGVMSHDAQTSIRPALRPVLSLRAVVARVKKIGAGDSVSYGRTFTADKQMCIATVCIGYGDGVPRQMSGNGGMCIVNGHKVPIVGRICMDLLMVDVTDAGTVKAGDIVTLIGRDGDEEIRCEDFAAASDTITNDILCRLGSRLPRVYLDR